MTSRPLRVFLCHSSNDKPAVRELYQKLCAEPWIDPWLDEIKLLPGQEWDLEIEQAIKETDAIIVCVSKSSITKEGYVQKEIKKALDYSDEKPEGTVFVIPVRLEECQPPERLSKWQYADFFEGQPERGFQRIVVSLEKRAKSLNIYTKKSIDALDVFSKAKSLNDDEINDLFIASFSKIYVTNVEENREKFSLTNGMKFVRVPAGKFLMGSDDGFDDEKPAHVVDIPYEFWISKYPVTNDVYDTYVRIKRIKHPVPNWKRKKDFPVVNVSWDEIADFCKWTNYLIKDSLAPSSKLILRLPTEAEWEKSARGTEGLTYPWGNEFDESKCNTKESKRSTTMVGLYSPQDDSFYGCADMSGNVWEWVSSTKKEYPYLIDDGRENSNKSGVHVLRGGSYKNDLKAARCSTRAIMLSTDKNNYTGFRLVLAPPLP